MIRTASNSLVVMFTLILASAVPERADAQSHSKYAGQERRAIKSLSNEDIAELTRGAGWGFAKVAELNGVPGPFHLLEMKDQIALTPDQLVNVTKIYNQMREAATKFGSEFIQGESELDRAFRDGSITEATLKTQLERISRVRAKLRGVHLLAHLKVRPILSEAQVATYNRLRGYEQSDPCASPPKGHNIAMWRKHHGCK